jgi:hypothetical protein
MVTEMLARLLDESSFTAAAQAIQAEIETMPEAETVLTTQGLGGRTSSATPRTF